MDVALDQHFEIPWQSIGKYMATTKKKSLSNPDKQAIIEWNGTEWNKIAFYAHKIVFHHKLFYGQINRSGLHERREHSASQPIINLNLYLLLFWF